ncbi:AraC family transcriptional regulator [Paenibacillus harenae]|uniref:AraC family transcriptional regulator n=1 Tax=Paenibacillus harenae TaxID=306543 RepID=UPI0027D8AC79|nr:AraC family transcriptional regulator [Paenibacillus harenae]
MKQRGAAGLGGEQFLNDAIFELFEARIDNELPEWSDESRPLAHHTLLYIAKGQVGMRLDGLEAELERQSMHLFLPGTRLKLQKSHSTQSELHWLTFDIFRSMNQGDAERVFRRETDFPIQGQIRSSISQFKRYFYLLVTEGKRVQSHSRFMGQQFLYDLLRGILQQAAPVAMNDIEDRLKQTIHYMHSHYREEIRVDKLAEIAELHPTYYSQLFKRRLGKTPVSFLTHLRVNKAKEMMLQTDKTIRDIASDVGYGDEFYFSRRFKETSGYSPTLFMQKKDFRIVSLSYPYTDHLHTLGIQPCAAQYQGILPHVSQAMVLPRHRSELWEISREAFMNVKPDLILCKDNVYQKALENINDIAPIVSIPWSTKDIYSHLFEIAELVHRTEEANKWLERYEDKSEQLRLQVQRELGGATVAVCSARAMGLRMYGARNIGHVFYRSLKLKPPVRIQEQLDRYPAGMGFNWTAIDPHEIEHYEADYLFVAVETSDDRKRVRQWMRSDPGWMKHSAVRSGNVFIVDWEQWIVYAPQMVERQLEQAACLLAGAEMMSRS